jgi:hypothetical protein
MVMTYEELKAVAAPRPWAVPENVGYPVSIVAPIPNALVASANGQSQRAAVANALLIVHHATHFDAVLQDLKRCVQRMESEYPQEQWGREGILKAQETIRAAQRVK